MIDATEWFTILKHWPNFNLSWGPFLEGLDLLNAPKAIFQYQNLKNIKAGSDILTSLFCSFIWWFYS